MFKLTEQQAQQCNEFSNIPCIRTAYRDIITYKRHDESLALFRLTASNYLKLIMIRMVLNKPMTKPLKEYISHWATNNNTMIIDFVNLCAKHSNYKRKFTL